MIGWDQFRHVAELMRLAPWEMVAYISDMAHTTHTRVLNKTAVRTYLDEQEQRALRARLMADGKTLAEFYTEAARRYLKRHDTSTATETETFDTAK